MDYEDDLNLGEYYYNRDIFPQPNPENMPYESSSSGEPQPTFENDNSQPNEVDCEPTEPNEYVAKKRKRKSNVWDHFKVEEFDIGGGIKEDKAVCIYCKKPLSCKSNNGTGHLNKHAKKCVELHVSKSGPTQSQLSRKDNGSVATFKYSHARMREGLAKFLATEELPFSFAESPRFERFQREYCQPEFKHVPRNTNKNDVLKVYREEKKKLVHVFSNLNSSIAITSDL